MKRKLALIVCVIALFAMIFTLASCGGDGDKDHTHTYAQAWSSNNAGHWYAATCGCEGEVSNYGAHVDANKDGKCDTCAFVTCTHTYAEEWQSDETNHWNNPTCGCNVKGSFGAHADANKDGKCDTCAYVMCAHTYADTYSSDATNHWFAANCGCQVAGKGTEKHIDEVLDGICDKCQYVMCTHTDLVGGVNGGKNGLCDDCGYVMCEHEYETVWSKDEANHWKAPKCGCDIENGSVGAHVAVVGDVDTKCRDCGYVICESHTFAPEKVGNDTHHWYKATCGCDTIKGKEAHIWANEWSKDASNHWHAATCGCEAPNKDTAAHIDEKGGEKGGKDGICDICSYKMHEHTYEEKYEKNGSHHWYVPTCGCDLRLSFEEHNDADGDFLCDKCSKEVHEHTYSDTKTWDAEGHWYPSTCGCEDMKKEYEEHTWATVWSSDVTGHWYATTCGDSCGDVKKLEARHVDLEGNELDGKQDGKCDVCTFVVCEHVDVEGGENGGKNGVCDKCGAVSCLHEFAKELSSNTTHHWYASTCGCDVVQGKSEHYTTAIAWENDESDHWNVCDECEEVYNKEAHVDQNKDGVCDDCEYVICTHNFSNAWSSNEVAHWYDATCGCYVNKDKADHVDEDADGACDTCTFKSAIKEAIDSIDGTASENTNSTVADVTTTVNGEETKSEISYKLYDNYIVEFDSYGNQNYYSYYGENGDLLFVVQVSEYGINRNEYATEPETVAYYSMANYSVSASNNEERIKNLYEFAKSQYGFASSYDESTKTYSISFAFTDSMYIDGDEYRVVTVANATFVIDENTNGIASANLAFVSYNVQDVEINPGADTYKVAEGAAAIYSEVYAITQTFGAPMDSTNNPNPYPASDYIITDFTLTDGTNVYEDGDEIELDAMDKLVLNFNSEIADKIKFNLINATATTSNGTALSSWSSQGTIEVDTWSDPIAVKFVGKQADTFTIVVDVEGTTLTLTAKVNYLTPDSISSVVYDEDDYKVTTSEYTIYRGQALKITSSVAAGCNPAFTATLPQGAAAALVDNGDGTYTFTPVMAGEFEITLTSTAATGVSTVLKITAIEPPAISDVLNGTHTGSNMYSGLTVGTTFTPSEEGALNGTVVVTVNGSMFSYATWEWETIEYSATYTYAYNDGAIELTYVEGDEFAVELSVVNYKVVALYDFTEYKLVQEEKEPENPDGPVVGGATESPITVTMTGAYTYCYDYEFTFVAGDAGYYTFTVPSGFGVISEADYQNYGQAYVDFQMDDGGTFTIQLSEGESFALRFGSLDAKDYELSFTYSETDPDAEEEQPIVPSAGSGTQADPFVITEAGDYVCAYPGGGWQVLTWYTYEATADGNVVFTFTSSAAQYGLSYGTDPNVLDNFSTSYGMGSTVTIPVTAGDVLILGVQEWNGSQAEVPFSIELPGAGSGEEEDPEVPSNTELTIGNNNIEGADVTYTYTANADGTLTLSCGNAIMGPVSITCTVNGNDAGEVVLGGNALVLDLVVGDTVVITVTASGYTTLNAAWAEGTGSGNPALVIGNNSIEAADVTYEYTASADETLVLSVGTAIMGPVTITYSINGGDALTLEANVPANVVLTAGDKLVVTVTASGYATLAVSVAGGEEEETEPDGSEANPFVWETLPEELTFTSDATNKVYYTFTATESGVLTITYAQAGDSWADLYAWANNEWDGQNSQSASMSDVATFNIVAGTTYRLGISTWITTGETTVTIAVGEGDVGGGEGDGEEGGETTDPAGSQTNPIPVENGGNYVANFPEGYTGVYYVYEVTENGYVTVTSDYTGTPWLQIGTNLDMLTANENYETTMKYYALAGQKVYIAVGDFDFVAAEVPFSVSFEAFESDPIDDIVGTWSCTFEQWGTTYNYEIVINADGTGTALEDQGWAKDEYTITFILVDGESIRIDLESAYGNLLTYNLTYDSEAGTIYNPLTDVTYTKAVVAE